MSLENHKSKGVRVYYYAALNELIITKTTSISNMQDVDNLVLSGAQEAIKEVGQGEGREK